MREADFARGGFCAAAALVLQEGFDSVGSQLFATRESDQFDAEQASSDLCLVMLDQPAAGTDSSAGGE